MIRKLNLFTWVAWFGVVCVIVQACASLGMKHLSQDLVGSRSPGTKQTMQFPVTKGTRWIYSYSPYQATLADPTQTMTATFIVTETVITTEISGAYFAAKVERTGKQLVGNPQEWTTQTANLFNDSLVVISGTQVFESAQPANLSEILNKGWLIYNFPLAVGKSWCPYKQSAMPKPMNCEAFGKVTVRQRANYTVPAGHFENCFEIVEAVPSGGVITGFCPGIGIVQESYDHGGSKFGFRKILIDYSIALQ